MIKIILLDAMPIRKINASSLLIMQEVGTWYLVACGAVEGRVEYQQVVGTCHVGFQIWMRVNGATEQNAERRTKSRF